MITPKFKLDQNDDYLFINIRVPYAKLNEVDVFAESNDFRFYCKPYYLRLNLPGNVIESNESGIYDVDEGMFKFKLEKANKGEHFDGLELITKLLTPVSGDSKQPQQTVPLIEELDIKDPKEEQCSDDDDDEENDAENGDQWYVEQQNPNLDDEKEEDEEERILKNRSSEEIKYGFAQTKSNVFAKLSSEYGLVIDLPDPDNTGIKERRKLRVENEDEKFDDDHYLADLYENEYIDEVLLKYKPDFSSNLRENEDEGNEESERNETNDSKEFTQSEQDCLKSLPKRTYLLSKEQKFFAFAGLVDILYAYCYTNRVNCGEKNVEAGWTIAKLSSTLSWFDVFYSFEEVLVASYRRSLCFPFYRNWKLCKAVLKDLIKLLKKGRMTILKKLIEIRSCFIDGDCRYILNDLYINDYCVWIQYISEEKIANMVKHLETVKISKEMLEFDLECIELAGKLAIEEGDEPNDNEEEIENNDKKEEDEIKQEDDLDEEIADLKNLKLTDKEPIAKKKPLIEELD